jgi:hypothetical protein
MSSDATRGPGGTVTPRRPRRRIGVGRAGPLGMVRARVADGHRGQLRHDIVDVLRVGQDAPEVDDAVLSEERDLSLAILERSEQPDLHRIAATTEVGVGRPAGVRLGGRASDRHGQRARPRFVDRRKEQHGDAIDAAGHGGPVVLALAPNDLHAGGRRHAGQTQRLDDPVGPQNHADAHEPAGRRCRALSASVSVSFCGFPR